MQFSKWLIGESLDIRTGDTLANGVVSNTTPFPIFDDWVQEQLPAEAHKAFQQLHKDALAAFHPIDRWPIIAFQGGAAHTIDDTALSNTARSRSGFVGHAVESLQRSLRPMGGKMPDEAWKIILKVVGAECSRQVLAMLRSGLTKLNAMNLLHNTRLIMYRYGIADSFEWYIQHIEEDHEQGWSGLVQLTFDSRRGGDSLFALEQSILDFAYYFMAGEHGPPQTRAEAIPLELSLPMMCNPSASELLY